MNKKLFLGATAVSVVALGGYLYYRHVMNRFIEDPTDEEQSRIDWILEENDRLEQKERKIKDAYLPEPPTVDPERSVQGG